jgi:DNA polymerase elongation subunit (family B)
MVCLQEEFCVAKGFKTDCEVIYGDTDSVMVNFKVNLRRISSEPLLIVSAPQHLRCYHH